MQSIEISTNTAPIIIATATITTTTTGITAVTTALIITVCKYEQVPPNLSSQIYTAVSHRE